MVNKSVIIFCLCFVLSAVFSISVNATPNDEKEPPSVTTTTGSSSTGESSEHNGDSGSSSSSSNTTAEAKMAEAEMVEAKRNIEDFLKNNMHGGLIVNRPQIIRDVADGSLQLLDGKKWVAKNIENGGEITLSEARPDQNIYIYGCKNTTFIVPERIQHIAHIELQDCEGVKIRFPSVVSSLELSDSNQITINCLYDIKTIKLDRINDCKMYLPSEVADQCIFTHTQCKNLTVYRVLRIDGKTPSQPVQIPDSIMMSRGQDQSVEEKLIATKIHEQYLTRMEKDSESIYKTDENGKLIKNPKGEFSVIKQYSKGSNGELLSIKRCLKDRSGQYLVIRKTMEFILEKNPEWIWIKRYKMDENKKLVPDANGDWIQITRNANQLKDDQGYLILPENNKFPTPNEWMEYHINRLNQSLAPTTETTSTGTEAIK